MKSSIIMRLINRGVHRWPNQDEYPELAELHHHTFVIVASISEDHSREIEFIRFRKALGEAISRQYGKDLWNFDDMSCEDIAVEVAGLMFSMFPDRQVTVSVWEDEQHCAGEVEFDDIEDWKAFKDTARSERIDRPKSSLRDTGIR